VRHDNVVVKLAHSVTVGLQCAHPTTVYRRLICSDDAHGQFACMNRPGKADYQKNKSCSSGLYGSSLITAFCGNVFCNQFFWGGFHSNSCKLLSDSCKLLGDSSKLM
jgi:hypothetical protein